MTNTILGLALGPVVELKWGRDVVLYYIVWPFLPWFICDSLSAEHLDFQWLAHLEDRQRVVEGRGTENDEWSQHHNNRPWWIPCVYDGVFAVIWVPGYTRIMRRDVH